MANLVAESYELDFVANYLVIRNVPFLDHETKIRRATLACAVDVDVDLHTRAKNHTMWFSSEPPNHKPCGIDGQPLKYIGGADQKMTLASGLNMDRMFSAKRQDQKPYDDLHQKVTRYVDILGSPVFSIDPKATERGAPRIYEDKEADTPFEYLDTASTRAEIMAASQKLEGQVIAIIGLGGSGSYVLDFVAKTPVKEIRLFDGDEMQVHNAFRSPGAASVETLRTKPSKVEYLHGIYSRMKKGITRHGYLTAENTRLLEGAAYAFLCIDDAAAKPPILAFLRARGIPFTDVGMGLSLADTSVRGTVRVTSVRPGDERALGNIATAGDRDDVYRSNVQVADLNALAAILAVIRWKKQSGFYADDAEENNTEYLVRLNAFGNEP